MASHCGFQGISFLTLRFPGPQPISGQCFRIGLGFSRLCLLHATASHNPTLPHVYHQRSTSSSVMTLTGGRCSLLTTARSVF